MSWVRTGLTLVVVSLLLMRLATRSGTAALAAGLVGVVVAFAMITGTVVLHRRNDASLREGVTRPPVVAITGLVGLVLTLAATSVLLVLT